MKHNQVTNEERAKLLEQTANDMESDLMQCSKVGYEDYVRDQKILIDSMRTQANELKKTPTTITDYY